MCTLSWAPRDGGYTMCFNRDERLSRATAIAPAVIEAPGARYIAPRDGDFGGTWIAVNQFGLSLALLNRYGDPAGPPPADPLSRGRVIPSLIDCSSRAEIVARSRTLDLNRFPPFTLVVLEAGRPVWVMAWDGFAASFTEERRAGIVVTSSAVDQAGANRSRRAVLAELLPQGGEPTAAILTALHGSHLPTRGSRSVCMHRDDAETQSFSRIEVGRVRIEFHHIPDSPCRGAALPPVALERTWLAGVP